MPRERGFKRIAGIDRSQTPNELTTKNQGWRPWTIPNFIGYARALLIPVFFVIAWNSPDGRDTTANVALFICGASDYLDGLAARLTGQFSRLGTLLDPLIDRVMILAAGIIIFKLAAACAVKGREPVAASAARLFKNVSRRMANVSS